jgi:class 3 adenylate cyclase
MSRGTAREAFRNFFLLDVGSAVPLVQAPTLIMYSRGRLGLLSDTPEPSTGSSALWLGTHLPFVSLIEIEHGDLQWWWQPDLRAQMLEAVCSHFAGKPASPNVDRVLATVVFTDIVRSTERAASMGDRQWIGVIKDHDALADRELQRTRGKKIKSTGDGLLATFDGPARAVTFAEAMCTGARSLGLEIRAGVHTGEIEQLGDDIGGLAVHIGQRVSAQADAAEVLVTRTVVDLVVGSGMTFLDRGDIELKGVPGTWSLFSLMS